MTILAGTNELFCVIYYIMHVFWYFLPTTLVFILLLYVLCAKWYVLNMWYTNFDVYIFFTICHDFFIIFLAFYVAFCAYRPNLIRVAETDPSRCQPSRRPRPRLWTMINSWWSLEPGCDPCLYPQSKFLAFDPTSAIDSDRPPLLKLMVSTA